MSNRRDATEQAALDAAFTELFEQRIAFNQVMGLKVESLSADEVRMRLAMRPDLVGHYVHGILHGGVISATLDTTGGMAVMVAIAEKHAAESAMQVMQRFLKMGTIDLRIDYLRPGRGRWFTAHAQVIRLGGRVASTQMRLVNDEGILIATGAGAYIVS